MADLLAAEAAISSLKAALDIAKSLIGTRDDVKLNSVVFELQQRILEAQQFALTANADQFTMARRASQLEDELRQLKEWKAREGEYKLEEIPSGAFAYVRQPTDALSDIEVWLCPSCFENRQRSVLQFAGRVKGGHGEDEFKCQSCRGSIQVEMGIQPGMWRERMKSIREWRKSQGN